MIEAIVSIRRPVEDVFSFYRDFRNLPSFLGDVIAVEPLSPATSLWTIQGPLGMRASWTIRVTDERPNELIRYETVAPPGLRTSWEIRFASSAAAVETEVRETLEMPLGRLAHAALALIGKFPAAEVAANLHRLKQILETGRVTDTSYSVPGKFPPPDSEAPAGRRTDTPRLQDGGPNSTNPQASGASEIASKKAEPYGPSRLR